MTNTSHATLTRRTTLIGLSAIVALSGCSKRDNASAAETSKTQTMIVGAENIAVATNGSIMTGPSISGTLEPEREAAIRSQVSGSVLQTYADQGQAVSPGTVLARSMRAEFRMHTRPPARDRSPRATLLTWPRTISRETRSFSPPARSPTATSSSHAALRFRRRRRSKMPTRDWPQRQRLTEAPRSPRRSAES